MDERWGNLIATVEQATAPDRFIDACVYIACENWRDSLGLNRDRHFELSPKAWGHVGVTSDDNAWMVEAPAYTASLEAVIALAERVLKGVEPLIGADHNYGFDNDIPGAEEAPRWNAWCYGQSGMHPTSPAIALLLALLRAHAVNPANSDDKK